MSIPKSSQLALGTVQFGLNYGISNTNGVVNKNQIKLILSQAYKSNINTLDTAIVYGESEGILGDIGIDDFNVLTKLPPVPENQADIRNWAIDNIYSSMKKLNVSSLYALLLHNSVDILGERGKVLNEVLLEYKYKGLIEKIGASIYDTEELDDIENSGIDFDIIQAPFNVFDRRLELSGWLSRLGNSDTEVHIRSVFLQGLLLLSSEARPKYFSKWEEHFKLWDDWLEGHDISSLEACLNFVKSYSNVDKIIVGVTNVKQLLEIISIFEDNDNKITPESLISNDQLLINPTNWFK